MIITNSTPDKFYFEQLLAFLMSVRTNSPGHSIRVFLANYPEDMENRFKKAFPEFIFENRELEMIDDRGFSLIIFRASLIKECFKKYSESVAWIDTDVIVRASLSGFLDVESNQLKILKRKTKTDTGSPINAGIFNLGYSKPTYRFVCDWLAGCISTPKWGQGQARLWDAYLKNKSGIELVNLGDKYNDLGGRDRSNAFSSESIMWHCKKNHFDNLKFQSEYQIYLEEAEKLYYG